MIYSDEYLEYWGEVFRDSRLHSRRGVPFVAFLANPTAYLKQDIEIDDDALPLLEQQRDALTRQAEAQREDQEALLDEAGEHEAEKAEAAVAHLVRRNGVAVEPLHHRRYPRTASANFWGRRKRKGVAS